MFHIRISHHLYAIAGTVAALLLPSFCYKTSKSRCIHFSVWKFFDTYSIICMRCFFSCLFTCFVYFFFFWLSVWLVGVCVWLMCSLCPGFELWNLFKSHEQRLDTRAYLGSFNNLHVFAIQSYRLRWHQVKLFPLVDFQLVLNLNKYGGGFPLQILFK